MALTVEIVSHDTVKPYSPTPPSFRNYKLSHMDQLFRDLHIPILLFYSNTIAMAVHHGDPHHRLKRALAVTLTHMYPFAGRLKQDGMSIDCNDDGAEYIVTRINESMSNVLENPSIHLLKQLLPSWPRISSTTGSQLRPLVALQINHFSCGGVAIGASIGHCIADASAATAFLQMWATICYRDDHVPNKLQQGSSNFIFTGRTTLYPPVDNNIIEDLYSIFMEDDDNNYKRTTQVSKLLVFNGPKVAAIKGNMQNPTTRVQAVMAFIWAALISTSRDRNQELEMHVMATPVNIRNKMDPPLPACTMGNMLYYTVAAAAAEDIHHDRTKNIEMDELVQNLKGSIDMVTEDLVRKEHGDPNKFFINLKHQAAPSSKVDAYDIISWCRFPYYETDFGWGKPVWVATLPTGDKVGFLLDTSDRAGIQAWLRVESQDMEKLEKDPNFLAYVSAIHTL